MTDSEATRTEVHIERDADGLYLTDGNLCVRGDLAKMARRLKPNNLSHELLVRAAKVPHGDHAPTAIDATTGLGEDSILLAAAGFHVTCYERNATIAALLRDSLERAAEVPELADAVERMRVVEGDSVFALQNLTEAPDIILLDPMFPEKHKASAVKKKLQLLQQLETPCEEEQELLDAALDARPRKVIVKRPIKGPYLADRKPSYSLSGKAVRFDCYV